MRRRPDATRLWLEFSFQEGHAMDVVLIPLINLVLVVINLYIWVLVISVVLSWLVGFNVVNTSNRLVYIVMDFSYRITEPALRPIRRYMPDFGGVDLSPLVLILILWFFEQVLKNIAYAF